MIKEVNSREILVAEARWEFTKKRYNHPEEDGALLTVFEQLVSLDSLAARQVECHFQRGFTRSTIVSKTTTLFGNAGDHLNGFLGLRTVLDKGSGLFVFKGDLSSYMNCGKFHGIFPEAFDRNEICEREAVSGSCCYTELLAWAWPKLTLDNEVRFLGQTFWHSFNTNSPTDRWSAKAIGSLFTAISQAELESSEAS